MGAGGATHRHEHEHGLLMPGPANGIELSRVYILLGRTR